MPRGATLIRLGIKNLRRNAGIASLTLREREMNSDSQRPDNGGVSEANY